VGSRNLTHLGSFISKNISFAPDFSELINMRILPHISDNNAASFALSSFNDSSISASPSFSWPLFLLAIYFLLLCCVLFYIFITGQFEPRRQSAAEETPETRVIPLPNPASATPARDLNVNPSLSPSTINPLPAISTFPTPQRASSPIDTLKTVRQSRKAN